MLPAKGHIPDIPEPTPNSAVNCTVCGQELEAKLSAEEKVYRIFGDNRYETAMKTADQLKEILGIDKFHTVVVATGNGYADALSGSYLAVVKDAPILLVNEKHMEKVQAYIKENLEAGGVIYLLGGENSIPKAMENGLTEYAVTRLAGKNRYETNLFILQEANVKNEEILVCTGKGFADSLSASAVGKPILLVGENLRAEQKDYLDELTTDQYYIIGGTGAVNEQVESEIKAYGHCERIGGENRYETSILTAKEFVDNPNFVVLAYSRNYPDGLCGGVLAAKLNAPLILTMTDKEAEASTYIQNEEIYGGYILGGQGLISDHAVRTILQMSTEEEIIVP